MRSQIILIIILSITLLFGCSEKEYTNNQLIEKTISDITPDQWKALSQAKIYFAHKSVGEGIVQGLKDVMVIHPIINLKIINGDSPEQADNGVFLHSYIGHNSNPQSKMEDFECKLGSGLGDKLDYAILKFCWADILPNTDVKDVFNQYKEVVSRVQSKYPNIQIIHFTIPLTSNETGFQAFVKKIKDVIKIIIGKINYYENNQRNMLNEMMRKEYQGKSLLFDLAEIENGSQPDIINGVVNQSFSPDYTDDGAHLNQKGRIVVAENFLVFLAETIKNR